MPAASAAGAYPSAAADGGSRIDRLAPWLALAYVVLTFAWYCVWKHYMAERSADEACFENLLWNANHGLGLRSWIEGDGHHHFATHFSPALYLLVPLYRLIPSMHVVHLAVSALTAIAGLRVHRMARAALDPAAAGLVFGAFLLMPTIVLQTAMEFHEQALALLPLVLVIECTRGGRAWGAWVAALALLSVREDNALFLLALAGLGLFRARERRTALGLLVLVAAWSVLARAAMERAGAAHAESLFRSTYGQWGSTPAAAARAVLADPARVLHHLTAPRPVRYLAQLLAPFLGVLPWGDPMVLAMVPQLLLILLADPASRLLEVRMHYSIVPVTALTVGAIGTLGWLRVKRAALSWLFALALFVATAATVPLWLGRAVGRLNPRVPEIRRVLGVVPDTASVTAPGYLLNQMARRPRLAATWTGALTTTEYVILEDRELQFYEGASMEVPFSPRAAETLSRAGYVEVYARDGWHVWRRRRA